jgi:hypothetical protein
MVAKTQCHGADMQGRSFTFKICDLSYRGNSQGQLKFLVKPVCKRRQQEQKRHPTFTQHLAPSLQLNIVLLFS